MPTNKKLTPEMEANRCDISARDCDEARKYLETYRALEGRDISREGLLLAAIVSYSRAFIPSHGEQFAAPMVGVDLIKVFHNDPSKIKLHKTILERRHNAIAHATWKYHQSEVVNAAPSNGVLRKCSVVDYGKGIDIEVFRDMAETMRDQFQRETFDRDVSTKAKPKKED